MRSFNAILFLAFAALVWPTSRAAAQEPEATRESSATALTESILGGYEPERAYSGITVLYPVDETLFPPEIVPPTFHWKEDGTGSDTWLITMSFSDDQGPLSFVTQSPRWAPPARAWDMIKRRSREKATRVSILGVRQSAPAKILAGARLGIRISADEVGAPIFFREVELPLIEAAKDPTRIRWRLGAISSPRPPPVVLEKLAVCGNCHSFSQDGKLFAMDVDHPSKGAYVITRIAKEMALTPSDLINWDDYKRDENERTFGLLSQLSPDGRFVVSTVKDKNVFIPRGELSFSQLFFPIRGILATYDRSTRTFRSLPGADDPNYVQSNPVWSPDGQQIVFARGQAYQYAKGINQYDLQWQLTREFDRQGRPFLFDLYRIPFNGGQGGKPEPLAGASRNGVSNFFPKYSPDGKWIVFCRAKSYMMLQPDSELYIIPAQGGEARRLRANTSLMNSWHSWSPNGHWLVFASKAFSPYTQLFLTHIDSQGESSPPVWLADFTDPERAANIPEFVNAPATAIERITERFANDVAVIQTGNEYLKVGEIDAAISEYQKALALNPNNGEAQQRLGLLLFHVKGLYEPGLSRLAEALRLSPRNPYFQHDLGMAQLHQGQLDLALQHLAEALWLSLDVKNEFSEYNPYDTQHKLGLILSPRHRRNRWINPVPEMEFNLGLALLLKGDAQGSTVHLANAVSHFALPNDAKFQYLAAMAWASQGSLDKAREHYAAAMRINPEVASSLTLPGLVGKDCAFAEQFRDAVLATEQKLRAQ
jgi:tetratricopeptide (TPR) repeat protein